MTNHFLFSMKSYFFKSIPNFTNPDNEIKKIVSQSVEKITPNEIHKAIIDLDCKNILTTNYDISLELAATNSNKKLINKGFIVESKYSLFRKHMVSETNFWHIHGSANAFPSITLGYEHYSGYLQHMRNYVVYGTKDTYKKKSYSSLLSRLKASSVELHSWIDYFFLKDIHILALSLDFHEIDLWWLLTYREKCKQTKKLDINNQLFYYIPTEFFSGAKNKVELLKSVGVNVVPISGYKTNKSEYYLKAIDSIRVLYT